SRSGGSRNSQRHMPRGPTDDTERGTDMKTFTLTALALGSALFATTAMAAGATNAPAGAMTPADSTMAPSNTMAPTTGGMGAMHPATGGMMAHHKPKPPKPKMPMNGAMK